MSAILILLTMITSTAALEFCILKRWFGRWNIAACVFGGALLSGIIWTVLLVVPAWLGSTGTVIKGPLSGEDYFMLGFGFVGWVVILSCITLVPAGLTALIYRKYKRQVPMVVESKERGWVWWLCGLAALRVFIFSAAFPFFNNVDEEMHFDAVMNYASGGSARVPGRVSADSARYIVNFGSPEYYSSPPESPSVPPPVWKQDAARIKRLLLLEVDDWQAKTNYEASSPPLYYAVAGAWLTAGRAVGMAGGQLLYWVRFLNVLAAAALVWLGFLAARAIFPGNRFMCLGVPALLAFFPQDFFYSIQSDVLSPLCFGAAFLGLVCWLQARQPDAKLAGLAGLALAAGCLVKTSNLPFLVVGIGAAFFSVWQQGAKTKDGNARTGRGPLLVFLLCAVIPVALLVFWNLRIHGDITGAGEKMAALGWTHKPFADWWSHPIFTPGGFWTFWRGLMVTFWRGESIWRGLPMSRPAVDAFYCLSSTCLIGLGLASLVPRWANATRAQRQVLILCGASVGASVLFLGALSVVFDFGDCPYPSRGYPYFASGRLLSGALIPFLLLYLRGLDWALSRQSPRSKWLVLAGIILLMTISETVVTRPVFSSQYNWFHLMGAGA